MFGLFKSKSEKLIGQLYSINRELHSSGRMACRKGTTFWWDYFFNTGKNLDTKIELLENHKGDIVVENILNALMSELSMPANFQRRIFDVYWPERSKYKSWSVENIILKDFDKLLEDSMDRFS